MRVLGIHDGHNASACLIVDGKVLRAVAEERFSRQKHHYGFPKHAVVHILEEFGLKGEDFDGVAMATKTLPPKYFKVRRNASFSISDYWKEQKEYWYPKIYQSTSKSYLDIFKHRVSADFEEDYPDFIVEDEDDYIGMWQARTKHCSRFLGIEESKIYWYDHHKAHSAYGTHTLREPCKEEFLTYTIDGGGDGCNATVSLVKDGFSEEISRSKNCNIGRMYRYATLLLGMRPADHEFKVMGLAAYASEKYAYSQYEVYAETLQNDGLGFKYDVMPTDNFFYFKEKLEGSRFDSIAYAIQRRTEELILEWVKYGVENTGAKRVVLSGGVAQNIKSNMRLSKQPWLDELFIPPGPGDESISIGAAYLCNSELTYGSSQCIDKTARGLKNAYIGITSSNKESLPLDLISSLELSITKADANIVALQLAKGKIFGRMQLDSSEFGPRALGARSIIADPRSAEVIHTINKMIKMRDFWMPFAPSILEECVADYLLDQPCSTDGRYMCMGYETTQLARLHIPAGIHPFDQTARAQIVSREDNPSYHELISEFKRITGVGAVLNTSFNVHGEPIVNSIEDALDTLKKSGLNGVIIGDWLVEKAK